MQKSWKFNFLTSRDFFLTSLFVAISSSLIHVVHLVYNIGLEIFFCSSPENFRKKFTSEIRNLKLFNYICLPQQAQVKNYENQPTAGGKFGISSRHMRKFLNNQSAAGAKFLKISPLQAKISEYQAAAGEFFWISARHRQKILTDLERNLNIFWWEFCQASKGNFFLIGNFLSGAASQTGFSQ